MKNNNIDIVLLEPGYLLKPQMRRIASRSRRAPVAIRMGALTVGSVGQLRVSDDGTLIAVITPRSYFRAELIEKLGLEIGLALGGEEIAALRIGGAPEKVDGVSEWRPAVGRLVQEKPGAATAFVGSGKLEVTK